MKLLRIIISSCLLISLASCRAVSHKMVVKTQGPVFIVNKNEQSQKAGKELGDIAPNIPIPGLP